VACPLASSASQWRQKQKTPSMPRPSRSRAKRTAGTSRHPVMASPGGSMRPGRETSPAREARSDRIGIAPAGSPRLSPLASAVLPTLGPRPQCWRHNTSFESCLRFGPKRQSRNTSARNGICAGPARSVSVPPGDRVDRDPSGEAANGILGGPVSRPAERSVYLLFGQFAAPTLMPSKVPLLLGYSHHTGEPPRLHSVNPTNRPLQPLSISTSNAAEKSLYVIFIPTFVHQLQIDLNASA
jgi:hypothetical protein